jgi:hypothetical protein
VTAGGFSPAARGFAGIVALCAGAGLATQMEASMALTGSVGGALWAMLRYFTVLANLLTAVVYAGVALGVRPLSAPSLLGGATLAILLVGVVYGLLLRDLLELSGGAKLADFLLHHVTPVLAPLFWLGYAPKGTLSRAAPWRWAVFPSVYFLYALARGAGEGLYAYPFMNPVEIGWPAVALNGLVIAIGFVAAGYVMLWLDGRLSRRADLA